MLLGDSVIISPSLGFSSFASEGVLHVGLILQAAQMGTDWPTHYLPGGRVWVLLGTPLYVLFSEMEKCYIRF